MDWDRLVITQDSSIRDVLQVIESGGMQFAISVDGNGRLAGVVGDGDIRRALLQGASTSDSVEKYINKTPLTIRTTDSPRVALQMMREHALRQIPVVDEHGRVHDILTLQGLTQVTALANRVVLMAGGKGRRLGELTEACPKPLLKVGGKPILETIVETFAEAGLQEFWVAVNYHGNMIRDYFKDGKKWGISIRYIEESAPLGTAGALSLLPFEPEEPVIVMNGDILTKLSPQRLLEAHEKGKGYATMVVKPYETRVPYGVVQSDANGMITAIEEKPVQKFFVSAGIYVLSAEALRLIPQNTYFDMPDLFQRLITQNLPPYCFELADYWIDIGQVADFHRANNEFNQYFG